jgi:hypothetical protein
LAFWTQNKAKLCKKFNHNIVFFLEKDLFFHRKWFKIEENCDYNIGPGMAERFQFFGAEKELLSWSVKHWKKADELL